jgi:hypothetical protein
LAAAAPAEPELEPEGDRSSAKTLDDEGVARRPASGERLRPCGRSHPVRRVDVVLDQHGDAVHRAAQLPCAALRIERRRDVERVRIGLEHVPE